MSEIEIPLEERLIGNFLRKQAKDKRDKPFLTMASRTFSFGEWDGLCRAVARGLAQRKVGDGDRVVIMSPNCPEFIMAWFASSLLGAAIAPINPNLKGILLEAILIDASPAAIVIHSTLVEELAKIDPKTVPRHVIVVGGTANAPKLSNVSVADFESLYIHEGPDPEIPGNYRRIQTIGYTSGTTGPSKGAMIPNSAAFCPPINYIKIMGMGPDDSIYSPLPLFHGMSSRHGAMPSLVMGTHITIDDNFSASRYWERAAETGATLGMVIHALVPLLTVQPAKPSDRGHKLRAVFNAKHDEAFEKRFGVVTVECYAVTETSHILHTPYPERRWGSTGRVNPEWEVRLVDANDRPVARGEPGELICRPKVPHIMMTGYLNKPEVTLESFRGLWYRTGDILREDEDGYFYYLDRKKDRIRRRGENVSSADVEISVVAHPEVVDCAVVPHPAEDGEDYIRAIVVLAPSSKLKHAELYQWLQGHMPKFMLPRYIEIVSEIPRTGTGKFEKHKLVADGLGKEAWDAVQAQSMREPVAVNRNR